MITASLPRSLHPLLSLGEGFERHGLRVLYLGLVGAVLFFFPFGLLFVAGGLLPERFSWTASVIMTLTAGATLVSETRARPLRSALVQCAVLSLLLFGVEYLGVRSGVPFGAYAYTDALGFRVFGVPAAIPLAWYSTVLNAWRIAGSLVPPAGPAGTVGVAVLTGFLTLSLDILLEPMAAFVTRYWVWESGAIPLQNYASWFAFSVIIAFVLSRRASASPGRGMVSGAMVLLGTQCLLFCATILRHGFVSAVIVSGLLVAGALVTARIAVRARRER